MNSTTRGFHWTHFADKKVSDSSSMSVSLGAVAAGVTAHSWLQALGVATASTPDNSTRCPPV